MQPPNFSLIRQNVLFTSPSLILQSRKQDVFNISKHILMLADILHFYMWLNKY